MPYQYVPYSAKRRFYRSYAAKKAAPARQKATRTMVKKTVERMLRPEVKNHLQAINGSITSTGTVSNLNAMSEGTEEIDRVGRKVLCKSITIRYRLLLDTAAHARTSTRFLLVRDTQQVADTAPTVGAVLNLVVAGATVTCPNYSISPRFQVIDDWVVTLDTAQGIQHDGVKHYKLDKQIYWNGPLSTDIQRGGFWLIQVSDVTTNGSAFNALCDMAFTDV